MDITDIPNNMENTNFSEAAMYYDNGTTNQTAAEMGMALGYRLRFIPYTTFATACVFFNVLSIGAMLNIRGHRSAHTVLLLNLAVCDLFGSLLLWMYYNSPQIFPRFKITTLAHCTFITLVLVAPFILSLCNSFFSLLMLALNQYMAICSPLWSATHVTKGRIRAGIVVAWVLAAIFAILPVFLMLAMTRTQHCTHYVTDIGVASLEICAYGLAGLIIFIVALYARVYRKILLYRKEQVQIRRNRNGQDSESNFKAFITTAILTGTLVLFWLPYMVFHFISAHVDYDSIPDSMLNAKFYIIDFLPMLNFLTDPIVYGIRMKDIRAGYKRLFSRVLPCCCSVPVPSRQNGTVRSSVRFTTLDTSI